jgi:hypothetical protein
MNVSIVRISIVSGERVTMHDGSGSYVGIARSFVTARLVDTTIRRRLFILQHERIGILLLNRHNWLFGLMIHTG